MPATYISALPLRQTDTTMVVPMFFSSRSRAAMAMISSLAWTMERRMMFLVSSLPTVAADVLLQLARHDLDGPLAGHLAGGLAAHAVGHQADRHVGERLDVDGVFVVFPVVAQQGAFADIQRQGHGATSFWIVLAMPSRTAPPRGERGRSGGRPRGRPTRLDLPVEG